MPKKKINTLITLIQSIYSQIQIMYRNLSNISCSSRESCFIVCSARIVTFQLLFEFSKCRELSDIDGNIVTSLQSRIVTAFLDIFKVISWDLQVLAIPCTIVGVLGSTIILIPKACRTLPVDYFVCHN